jgi:hypothetical protein
VRRFSCILALTTIAFSACAAPEIRLQARFVPGEVREYRLVADADVRISAGGGSTVERTHLVASTKIEVKEVSNGTATLTLTVSPRSLERDGRSADPPAPQQIEMQVGPDGRVTGVTSAEGAPVALEAAEVEDLVPLIGPPLPTGRVRLASRWSRVPSGPDGLPAGIQRARLAALRVIDGHDCAIVALSTRRSVVRQRQISGTTLRLQGIEYASGEIAFAFREGIPVTVRSDGEARLAISGGAAAGGEVVIRTDSSLELVRRTTPR